MTKVDGIDSTKKYHASLSDLIGKYQEEHELKNTTDLRGFFRNLIGSTIELLYDQELKEVLGYEKHEIRPKEEKAEENPLKNYRNGTSEKTVRSQFGVRWTPLSRPFF
jgi:transposase-like protein